jgi:signal transduction histidine kinase
LRQGQTIVLERLMRRKNGTLFSAEVRTRMIADGIFQGILRDIDERKRLERALQTMLDAQRKWNVDLEDKVRAKTAELHQLSETRDQLLRQIMVAQEEEHRRVARELHDETSQSLTALIANLAVVQSLPAGKAKARLDEVKGSIVEILKGVNQIVLDLRPTLLDDYGLMPALSWYANKRLGSSTRVEITAPEPELRLPSTVETTLFRIGQEAITNIAKHAKASCVQLNLAYADGGKSIRLQVVDDGIGFCTDRVKNPDQADRPHLGLVGMRERAELIGGVVQIETTPNRGTIVSALVPLNDGVSEE